MVDKTGKFVFVGFWKRVLATLIDVAIGWAFMPVALPLMSCPEIFRQQRLERLLAKDFGTSDWISRSGMWPLRTTMRRPVSSRSSACSWM